MCQTKETRIRTPERGAPFSSPMRGHFSRPGPTARVDLSTILTRRGRTACAYRHILSFYASSYAESVSRERDSLNRGGSAGRCSWS